jgi:excisionase family DNA binding protein
VDQVGKVGGECGFTPQPTRVESKFIDDHVAGADKQGGVADRRDWNSNGDRQAGPRHLLSVEEAAGPAPQPGLSTGRSPIGITGGQCGQLKHQYQAGDDRMEKLLLTVWKAADVLAVSRPRVYELLYAEQLDSVKIGRFRRVSLASVGRLANGPSAS